MLKYFKFSLSYAWYCVQEILFVLLCCTMFGIPLAAMFWGFDMTGPIRPELDDFD